MPLYLGNQEVAINNIAPLQNIILRPDAQLIQTYTFDSMLVEDQEVTIPEYTTSSTTLLTSQDLSPTITPDYDNYSYFIVEKILSIPTYSVTTLAKGRQEYGYTNACYEIVRVPENTYQAITGGKTVSSAQFMVVPTTIARHLYYSSATALGFNTSASYGIHQAVVSPTANATTILIKSPNVTIRGHATYFTQTFFNALTDCRLQYNIKIYRSPNKMLNIDGWQSAQNILEILNNVNSNNRSLT